MLLVEQMLAADGHDPAALIKSVFSPPPREHGFNLAASTVACLAGFGEGILRRRDLVAEAIRDADAPRKAVFLGIFLKHEVPPEPFLELLVALAIGRAKTVREAAARLLDSVREQARPLMEQVAMNGSPGERATAHGWIGRYGGEPGRAFLQARREAEKNANLQAAIREALGETPVPECQVRRDSPPRPPQPTVETFVPLSPLARRAVTALAEAHNQAAVERNRALAAHR
ncbi:MAG: hypothetical protein ACREJM_10145, partial [Candidatus Saccharimonadales bacterium]